MSTSLDPSGVFLPPGMNDGQVFRCSFEAHEKSRPRLNTHIPKPRSFEALAGVGDEERMVQLFCEWSIGTGG